MSGAVARVELAALTSTLCIGVLNILVTLEVCAGNMSHLSALEVSYAN